MSANESMCGTCPQCSLSLEFNTRAFSFLTTPSLNVAIPLLANLTKLSPIPASKPENSFSVLTPRRLAKKLSTTSTLCGSFRLAATGCSWTARHASRISPIRLSSVYGFFHLSCKACISASCFFKPSASPPGAVLGSRPSGRLFPLPSRPMAWNALAFHAQAWYITGHPPSDRPFAPCAAFSSSGSSSSSALPLQ